MNKKVVCVDLNPLSRTSLTSDISIVDNIIRVIPKLIENIEYNKKNCTEKELRDIVNQYDNKKILEDSLDIIKSSSILSKK
jgi:4-phosphopantoate--beta-alanine ligase